MGSLTWNEGRASIDGVEFRHALIGRSATNSFHLRKNPRMIRSYEEFARRLERGRILEIGIMEGGSSAFLAMLAAPKKLVGVELDPDPVPALARFIEDRGLDEVVRPYFGVDQSDEAALREICRDEFGDEPTDLVIDDASHLLGPTRASFDVLFPLVRPGGRYIIEDWNTEQSFVARLREAYDDPTSPEHQNVRRVAGEREDGPPPEAALDAPLGLLGIELMLACNTQNDLIEDVTFTDWSICVSRGPGKVSEGDFRLADCYVDVHGLVADRPQ